MENKFERIIENLEEEETLTLVDQTFLNEMILDESIQCSILGTLTFFEVDFKRVNFTGSTFVNCAFKNCRFKDVIPRNCIFIKSSLTVNNFSKFEFIETKFNNSDLDLIGARSIKVWKLNQCIEIEESSNFGDLLENRSSDG